MNREYLADYYLALLLAREYVQEGGQLFEKQIINYISTVHGVYPIVCPRDLQSSFRREWNINFFCKYISYTPVLIGTAIAWREGGDWHVANKT